MAGDYDLLTHREREAKLKAIIAELQLSIKSSQLAQKHFETERKNQGVFGWLTMWDEIEAKLELSRLHGTNATTLLSSLMTLDTIYPNFEFPYEWRVGWGGIVAITFTNSSGKIQFSSDGLGVIDCVPTGEITADDLVHIQGSAYNDGIQTITGTTSDSITTSVADETATNNTVVRIIRRTV